ncbi:MAG TPA: ferritin-like domain-containing protein [Myxococcales bacterium]|nr:ferritin-like domain-containing protein [Myxococcales bacterium]
MAGGAGAVWALRTRVEHEAARRFDRLAGAIARFDPESPLPHLLRNAADDERRHAALCATLSAAYGGAATDAGADPPIAPREMSIREAVLYEMVAACCITETESVATVTTLLANELEPGVEKVLREIARDEVVHGRMGWAHLAREASTRDVSFLSRWIPAMLAGSVDETLFSPAVSLDESDGLLAHGVLPAARKREVFLGTLEEVVLPGLKKFGIDVQPARAWLAERSGRWRSPVR